MKSDYHRKTTLCTNVLEPLTELQIKPTEIIAINLQLTKASKIYRKIIFHDHSQ